jgi:hypothetical protein
MGHPLTPKLDGLSMEELTKKISDLYNRLNVANRMGKGDMVGQLHLLIQDYQMELDNRNRKALEDLERNSKNFKGIIDIK